MCLEFDPSTGAGADGAPDWTLPCTVIAEAQVMDIQLDRFMTLGALCRAQEEGAAETGDYGANIAAKVGTGDGNAPDNT